MTETHVLTQHTIGEQKIETQRIHKMLLALKDGEVLSYSAIQREIGVNVQNGSRGLLYTAIKHAEKDTNRLFATVRGEGVKRLTPDDSTGVPAAARESLCRQARRAYRRTANVDYSAMSPEARTRLNMERTVLHFVGEAGSTKRLGKVEEAVSKANESIPFAKTLELFQK